MQIFKLTIFFVCLIVSLSALAQSQNEFKIPLSTAGKAGQLDVETKLGPVEVKGTSRQDVLVRYTQLGKEKMEFVDAGNDRTRNIGCDDFTVETFS